MINRIAPLLNFFSKKIQPNQPVSFVFYLTLAWSIFSVLTSFILGDLMHIPSHLDDRKIDFGEFFVFAVLLAPVYETLIFQVLPIEFLRKKNLQVEWQFLFSIFLFALAHFGNGVISGVSAGFFGGSVLAFAFVSSRTISFKYAVMMTWAVHFLFNFLTLALAFYFSKI